MAAKAVMKAWTLTAMQRDNAEMERRCQEVIDRC